MIGLHPILVVFVISLSWIFIELVSGFLTHRISLEYFTRDTWLFRTKQWEDNGRIYQRLFNIRAWKDSFPEAGAFYSGGFDKKNLSRPSIQVLERFIAETRRAELTHWLPLPFSFSFFLWLPWTYALAMPLIGFLGNLPFILIQRWNRPRFQRAVKKLTP